MLNAVAKQWVEALRSGKIKQSQGHLAEGDGRCCLGVLCDLAIKAGVIPRYSPSSCFLPQEVTDWAGLNGRDGSYERNGAQFTLAEDNDGNKHAGIAGKTFAEIADIIESEPKGLFK